MAADEKLTAFLEPGSGSSSETARGDFCQPWRGQAAARWNRRATRPNAIKVSVINDRVDPASATWPLTDHVPGSLRLDPPNEPKTVDPPSRTKKGELTVNICALPSSSPIATNIPQPVIAPVRPVANQNSALVLVRFVIVCTPSDNVKAVGDTGVKDGMFAPSGPANVTIAVTKSLVV